MAMCTYNLYFTMSAALSGLDRNEGLDLKPVYHFTRAANEMNGTFSLCHFAIKTTRNNSHSIL